MRDPISKILWYLAPSQAVWRNSPVVTDWICIWSQCTQVSSCSNVFMLSADDPSPRRETWWYICGRTPVRSPTSASTASASSQVLAIRRTMRDDIKIKDPTSALYVISPTTESISCTSTWVRDTLAINSPRPISNLTCRPQSHPLKRCLMSPHKLYRK